MEFARSLGFKKCIFSTSIVDTFPFYTVCSTFSIHCRVHFIFYVHCVTVKVNLNYFGFWGSYNYCCLSRGTHEVASGHSGDEFDWFSVVSEEISNDCGTWV